MRLSCHEGCFGMLIWQKGIVTEIIRETSHKQIIGIISTDEIYRLAINYPVLTGTCNVEDEVLYNATAVELKLGTGGYDFVIANLSNPPLTRKLTPEHIIKNRYTPLQFAIHSGEESKSDQDYMLMSKRSLLHTPVIIISLHSMLPIIALLLKQAKTTCRIVYIMTDSSSLPIWLSDHVEQLKNMEVVHATITAGQSFGGDLEAVNKYSALLLAKQHYTADYIIIGPGPGSVGTASKWGYSAIEIGELVNAVTILAGTPIVVPRISYSDNRHRHVGLSHHIITALSEVALAQSHVPLPLLNEPNQYEYLIKQVNDTSLEQKHHIHWIQPEETAQIVMRLTHYPLTITSMGREIGEDKAFFQGIQVAAQFASMIE